MSPRQRLSAEERRDQLMAATTAVVAADGFTRATADAIARSAGVSKGLLWHYFEDLEDLMEQTARRTLRVLAAEVGSALDLDAPVPEVVRGAVRAAASLLQTHAAERRALQEIVLNLRAPDGSQRLTMADYGSLHAAQEAIFRRGQREGHVRPGLDPRVLAVSYQGAVDAMLDYLAVHPEVDAGPFAQTVADVVLRGACVGPG